MMVESEAKALLKLWSIVLASLCYCYFIVSKIPKGKLRLFSLLPIFTLFTILPLTLSSILPAGITIFFITWLANFKLLLYSFNLGPLSSAHLSLVNFILISAFPIKIKIKNKNKNKYPSPQIRKPIIFFLSNSWWKMVISTVMVAICDIYKEMLNRGLLFVMHGCMLYLLIDVFMGIVNKIVGSIMGEELFPPSDEPYLSTSLCDFWGKRWNLIVTDMLRHTVYFPTRAFLSNYLGLYRASLAGLMVAFLVSGLMHELIFYYLARVSPSWEVTWFFVLHGLCVLLEFLLKDFLGQKLGLHWAITGPITVGFVMGTGYWWFFPPLARNQLDTRAIEEVMTLYKFIKGSFKIC